MKNQLIYITGLSHSGSTLLDLILGGHPDLIGLGEIYQIVAPHSDWSERSGQIPCSCGARMPDCSFWGGLCETLARTPSSPPEESYQIILKHFGDQFGDRPTPVDSSKGLKHLKMLAAMEGIELKVIHLIKDVRAYTISEIDVLRRRHPQLNLKQRISGHALNYFLKWHRVNREISAFLTGNRQIQHIRISYEDLCLNPEHTVSGICSFLNIPYDPAMLDMRTSSSHNVLGNRMRAQPEKRKKISYDNRWFYRNEWKLPMNLLPGVMRFNARNVYNTEIGKRWSA